MAAVLLVLAAGDVRAATASGQEAADARAATTSGQEDADAPAATGPGQQADDAVTSGLGLEVVRGYGGEAASSAWLPVAVFLDPDRPVQADISVRADGPGRGQATESRSVEVAAGARTVHRFLVPARRVSVVVDEAGREPVTVEPELGPPDRGFLAGVLGTAPRGLPALRAEETRTNGTWVPVDPAWLERSMVALEPLGTLVAERAELAELSPAAAANLAAGVVAGTDLVVVADAEGPLDLEALGLPASPAVSATATSVPAGEGGEMAVRTLEPDAQAWTLTVGDLLDDTELSNRGDTDLDDTDLDDTDLGDTDGADGADGADAVLAAATDAGRGRVAVVGVSPGEAGLGEASQLWEDLVGPGSRGRPRPDHLARGGRDLSGLFAEGGDRQLPSLPWFPVFLAAYVAVVGPVNWFVLRRLGRRELAWVTVPAVTAVFTAAAFFAAVSDQPPGGSAGRVAYWLDGVGGEVAAVGVRSPTPADRTVAFPGEGWVVAPSTAGGGGARVERTPGSETRVRLTLDALEPGGAVAWRTHREDPPLRVEAVAGRDGTEVTVTNDTGSAVEDVDVRVATARARVGDLPAGASETVVLSGPRLPARGLGARPGPPRPGRPGRPGSTEGLERLVTPSPLDGSPGVAWAIGSVEGEATGVSVDGTPADDAGTLLAVGSSVRPPDDGPVAPMAVRRSFHGGPTLEVIGPSAVELSDEVVLRYRLPAAAGLGRLYGDLRHTDLDHPERADITIWDRRERRWVPHAEALAGGADPARFVSPLGQVYVRATGEFVPFEFSARTVSGVDTAEEEQ